MPENPLSQPSNPTPVFFHLTSLQRGTEIPLLLNTIDSNTPMSVKALVDLAGTTGQFIDIEYVWEKNLWTQSLPRGILVYNVDGTLNDHEAGYITKVVDLIVWYKDHSEL